MVAAIEVKLERQVEINVTRSANWPSVKKLSTRASEKQISGCSRVALARVDDIVCFMMCAQMQRQCAVGEVKLRRSVPAASEVCDAAKTENISTRWI